MVEEEGIKEIYERFKEKFELPDFNIVDKELEASSLEPDKFVLRRIRNRVKDRLEFYGDIIEDLLHPDTSIAMLHECSFLTDKSKSKFFELYKRLMYMIRTADLLAVEKSTAKDAKYIQFYFSHQEILRRDMKNVVKLRMNSWKRELAEDIKVEYFG